MKHRRFPLRVKRSPLFCSNISKSNDRVFRWERSSFALRFPRRDRCGIASRVPYCCKSASALTTLTFSREMSNNDYRYRQPQSLINSRVPLRQPGHCNLFFSPIPTHRPCYEGNSALNRMCEPGNSIHSGVGCFFQRSFPTFLRPNPSGVALKATPSFSP